MQKLTKKADLSQTHKANKPTPLPFVKGGLFFSSADPPDIKPVRDSFNIRTGNIYPPSHQEEGGNKSLINSQKESVFAKWFDVIYMNEE